MGTNNATALGSHGKRDCLLFYPEQLTIVEDDPSHPHHDQRPKSVDESFVRDIMFRGIHTPIQVARAGKTPDDKPILHVIAGRKRVRAARIANARLAEMGRELVRVPGLVIRGDDADLYGVMVSENEQREQSTPLVRARQLQRYLSFGRTNDEALFTFKISKSTLRNYQALLECCAEVQEAVDGGSLSVDAAIGLSTMSHDEQRKALESMLAVGATKGRAAKEAVEAAKAGEIVEPTTTARKRSRAYMTRAVSALKENGDVDAQAAANLIRYLMGEDKALRRLPEPVRSVLRELDKAKAKKASS